MFKKSIVVLGCLLIPLIGIAQQRKLLLSKVNGSRADTNKISLLIRLSNTYLNQDSPTQLTLDSGYQYCNLALKLSNKLHEGSWRQKTMENIALYYFESGDQLKAVGTEKQLADIFHKKKNFLSEAGAWQKIGAYSSDLTFAQVCYKKAQLLFEKAGNNIAAIGALKEFGDNYKKRNELDSATAVLKDVIRQYQLIGYKKLQFTYDLIATIANIQGRIRDELINRIACIKSMEASGDYTNAALYYDGLSFDYWMFHKYPESLYYAQKCFQYNDPNLRYHAIGFIVTSLLALKKTDEAHAFLQKAIKKHPPNGQGETYLVHSTFDDIYRAINEHTKTGELNALSLQQDLQFQTELMGQMALYYNYTGDYVISTEIEKQIITFYQARKDRINEAKAWQTAGKFNKEFNAGNTYFRKAAALFKEAGDRDNEIDVLAQLGLNLTLINKPDSAKPFLDQVMLQFGAIGYKKDLYDVYNALATIATTKGRIKEAIFYRLAAIKNMEATGNIKNMPSCYAMLAMDYYNLKNYQQALHYEQKLFKGEGKDFNYGSASVAVFSLVNLKRPAEALAFLKKFIGIHPAISQAEKKFANYEFGNIYAALRQNNKAEEYYLQSTKFDNLEHPDPIKNFIEFKDYLNVQLTVIRFFNNTRQFKKADGYLKHFPDSLDKYIHPAELLRLNMERFKVDSASGNYVSAIKHYQQYKRTSDSIFNAKTISDAEERQIAFDRDKKDHAIKMLRSERYIQKMTTQKVILQRNVTLGAIIVALIIIGIVYYGYRRKKISSLTITQKNNQLELLVTDKELANLQISEKNNQLHKLISEKDWLLKEIHHRVKNNLHTVFCLLESQAKYLTDDALKAVEVSQHRIYAMSLIHQKLYQSADIKTIDMSMYITEFIGYLAESFDTEKHIRFELNLAPIVLDLAQAIPVGVILNEAITNAIKYAFPGGANGIISVYFQRNKKNILLNVTDNGIGISSLIDPEQTDSLGLVLMKGLTEDLKGLFTIRSEQGTSVEIIFPESHPHVN